MCAFLEQRSHCFALPDEEACGISTPPQQNFRRLAPKRWQQVPKIRYPTGFLIFMGLLMDKMLDQRVCGREFRSIVPKPVNLYCGGINPYTLTARLGPGGLAHYETRSMLDPTVRSFAQGNKT